MISKKYGGICIAVPFSNNMHARPPLPYTVRFHICTEKFSGANGIAQPTNFGALGTAHLYIGPHAYDGVTVCSIPHLGLAH